MQPEDPGPVMAEHASSHTGVPFLNLDTRMLASPMLSPASSTRHVESQLQPKPSLRDRLAAVHVFMGFLMSIIGAGMLSVPYTLVLVPRWQAIAGIIFVGSAMSCTANALLHAHVHAAARAEFEAHALGAGSKFVGFQALARRAGGPALGYAVSLIMASGVYGGCVGNLQIILDKKRQADRHVGVAGRVLLPLCMLRKLQLFSQRTTPTTTGETLASNGTQVSGTGSVDVSLESFSTASDSSSLQGNSFTRLAQSLSIYNFAFMMTLNLLPLFVQLSSQRAAALGYSLTDDEMHLRGDVSLCRALRAIGCAAFDLYGDHIDGNILLNLQSDPVMKIPLVATYLTVLFTFPLLFLPLRSLVEELLGQIFQSDDLEYGQFPDESKHNDGQSECPSLARLVIVLVLLCSQQVIALNVSGIEVVFSLMGATSCLVICYVFPVIAFTNVYPWHRIRRGFLWLALLWTIVGIVTFQGATCVWLLLTS
ncbi:Amino acid transporter, transmembrane domain [Phytophthora cactorum]|nr:Amino acid transporter, transmembrane domain [Phytophthora cactorum]